MAHRAWPGVVVAEAPAPEPPPPAADDEFWSNQDDQTGLEYPQGPEQTTFANEIDIYRMSVERTDLGLVDTYEANVDAAPPAFAWEPADPQAPGAPTFDHIGGNVWRVTMGTLVYTPGNHETLGVLVVDCQDPCKKLWVYLETRTDSYEFPKLSAQQVWVC